MKKIINIKNQESFEKIIYIYIFVSILYQTIIMIRPLKAIFYNSWLGPFIFNIIAIIGILFAFLRFLIIKKGIFMKKYFLLFLIVFSMAISTLFNLQYAFFDNIKQIVLTSTLLFVFYSFFSEDKLFDRHLYQLTTIITYIWGVACVISIFQFYFNISYVTIVDGLSSFGGVHDGRLYGIFGAPHFSSVFSMILIFLNIYCFFKEKSGLLKIYRCLVIIVFLVFIILSGSRATMMALMISSLIFFFCFMIKHKSLKKKKIMSIIILCIFSTLFVFSKCSNNLINANTLENKVFMGYQNNTLTNIKSSLYREETSDISNGRFQIWNDYLKLISKKPVFGYSPAGYSTQIRQEYPNLFIVSYIDEFYKDRSETGKIYDTHNGYLSILISTGYFGFSIIIIFAIFCLINIYRRFKFHFEISDFILFIALIAILITVFFDTDLFYLYNTTSLMFYTLLGCLMQRNFLYAD